MTRSRTTVTTTHVRHVAVPLGKERENGPHLSDLRAFVTECRDLPGDLLVHINRGNLDEGGRGNVTFEVRHRVTDEPRAAVAADEDVQPA